MSKEAAIALVAKGQELHAAIAPQIDGAQGTLAAALAAQEQAGIALAAAQEQAVLKDADVAAAGGVLDGLKARSEALAGAIEDADDAGDFYDAEAANLKAKDSEAAEAARQKAETRLARARAVIEPPPSESASPEEEMASAAPPASPM